MVSSSGLFSWRPESHSIKSLKERLTWTLLADRDFELLNVLEELDVDAADGVHQALVQAQLSEPD